MNSPQTVSEWNYTEEELQALVGKSLLVGMAHCNEEGAVVSREQFYGVIERLNFKEGIVVRLSGSNEGRIVPLDFTDFKLAYPEEYRLTGTGEVVKNPDYTMRLALNPKGEVIRIIDV